MLSDRVAPGFLIAVLLSPSAVSAASITNRDARDHKVTVIEGSSRKDHVLKPNAVLDGICEQRCLIRLGDNQDDPYELEGSDVTSIEEGQLYDDGSGVPLEPGSGSPSQGPDAQPSQSGPRP
ncbi:hypothetical protein [Hyphomicrobium sp. CS1GBMeth3]|uniref:hypothetical protein n=1 Tax=Hyphomicrobium sp. CS1GBMeth3 TaxID=1892845 RepID=UPI00093129D5|nr:hypothetical protein [Hyphomicrobium sp. CS1GBMeth3]